MKKQMISLAIGCAVVMPALAQTSFTLYGIADVGVLHNSDKGGVSSTELRSGNQLSSRYGFRGGEDLGGGLNAIFNLEAGINMDTGAASSATTVFNRQSWVGLSSTNFGQVTMGLQLSSISDLLVSWANAPYFGSQAAVIDGAATASGSSLARFDNMIGGTRLPNSIKFVSVDMSGFKAHAMTALGEVSGSTSAGTMVSGGLGYSRGAINAGLAYQASDCQGVSGCAANEDKNQIFGIGASYKFGAGRFGAIYTTQTNAKNVKGNDADTLSFLALVPVNAWMLMAGYQVLNDKTVLNQDVKQLNLGATYNLSPRTALYGLYSKQNVDNGGKAGMYSHLSSNENQSQLAIGMRQSF